MRNTVQLQESAISLLLRSPRLSVSLALDLLDISDRDFRVMVKQNTQIAELLEQRRNGELKPIKPEFKECPSCSEWFLPYAGARFCSDECVKIHRLESRKAGTLMR
ncbi:MAG: hypothetical protein O7F71_21550 [Gammaproteobacteria bacterium]|nr:hypothetical protein [Gammaproteobacteria bacterium]